VIAGGAAWQFRGWEMGGKIDADPVDIFFKCRLILYIVF
jgi:hypothetical protein